MATAIHTRDTVRTSAAPAHPGLMDRVKTYLARSRAQRQLHQLDDRLLADIGVRRSEIEKMVWGN